MIIYNEQAKTYTLHSKNTTYQMKVWDYGVLLHAYYGPRLRDGDLSCLLRRKDRGFSPNPNEAGGSRTFSLDTFPQEYSTCGVGDYRLPSIELELPSGSRTADLRYVGGEVRRGKYGLEVCPPSTAAPRSGRRSPSFCGTQPPGWRWSCSTASWRSTT